MDAAETRRAAEADGRGREQGTAHRDLQVGDGRCEGSGDNDAAKAFKAASIARAEQLNNPEAQPTVEAPAAEAPAPASAAIIKTLRKR
jgi:hypothetical protein